MDEIYCIFSIKGEENQPNNNLVCWFEVKPTIEELFNLMEIDMESDEDVLFIVRLSQGLNVEYKIGGKEISYRMQKVKSDVLLGIY